MLPLVSHAVIFLSACLGVWLGAGQVVSAVQRLARFLHISPFTFSFFILGILTSLPEIMIGTTALVRSEPELAIGNLVGGSLILFLLVIPLLALGSRGLRVPQALPQKDLIVSLVTIAAPALVIADRQVNLGEAGLLIALYLILTIVLFRRGSILTSLKRLTPPGRKEWHSLFSIIGGLVLIFVGSQFIVQTAEYYATALGWSPFVVGLLIVALGTNIPELSLALRAAWTKQSGIALAEYLGSAAANTLLMGIFSLTTGGTVALPNHAAVRIIVLIGSLSLFFCIRSIQKDTLIPRGAHPPLSVSRLSRTRNPWGLVGTIKPYGQIQRVLCQNV
jgi:cation:H+ antiporter